MGIFSSCKHNWHESSRTKGFWNTVSVPTHKCSLCGKEEDCVISGREKRVLGENYTETIYECETCGYTPYYLGGYDGRD